MSRTGLGVTNGMRCIIGRLERTLKDHARVPTHTYMYTHSRMHTHSPRFTRTHSHILTYMHARSHTYTRTCTPSPPSPQESHPHPSTHVDSEFEADIVAMSKSFIAATTGHFPSNEHTATWDKIWEGAPVGAEYFWLRG